MSALFHHLATSVTSGLVDDDIIIVLLGILWPLLEKLFRSSHMENVNLSAAVCRSLSSAMHSCGKLNGFLKLENSSCIANKSISYAFVFYRTPLSYFIT
jgi:transportin-3